MKKEKFFTIGEAAAAARTTSETLRHYDRIGLVRPSRKDPWTGYRYYTGQDIVRLNTVRALQLMDLSLKEIKEVLEYNDLEKIVDFLKQAEKKADEKIAALQYLSLIHIWCVEICRCWLFVLESAEQVTVFRKTVT